MINENLIRIINKEVDEGFKYFYFDKNTHKLVGSIEDNKNSLYELPIDTIELYLPYHVTIKDIVALLEYYNGMR